MKANSNSFILILCLALAAAPALAQEDPGALGPREVTMAEYDYGDSAFLFEGLVPTEVRARVHYPTDLTDGPFPLVIFLHGWHPTCYFGASAFLQWPCPAPREPIPSFQGYDYVARVLASHGYIVASISANGVNARDTLFFDVGMLWRGQLIQLHLDQWNTFHTVGAPPFDKLFVGKVDLQRVGTMGHSRGGEGVSRHYTYNREIGSPYGVKAVLPLAPVNFSRPSVDNTALNVLLPYCDGDVADLQGMHFFDDVRYMPADPTNKHVTLVMGGNHAFYNTIWTPGGWPAATWDDWYAFEDPAGIDPFCGRTPTSHKLNAEQTRGTGIAYFTGFFRLYLGNETQFLPLFKGDVPPPPSAMTNEILMSYQAQDAVGSRLDLNRLLSDENLTLNNLGGAVAPSGLTPYDLCGGEDPQPRHCLPTQPTRRQPHTTPSARDANRRGLSQLRIGWDDNTASWNNELPAGTGDVTMYTALQFRAAVNFTDPRNPADLPQDFSVTLTDGDGNSATVLVSAYSSALYYPPGGAPGIVAVPRIILNTVRIPLTAFAGVNLADVRGVQLKLDQQIQGGVLISDLAFSE